MQIKYEKIRPGAVDPTKAYPHDACWDLYYAGDGVVTIFSNNVGVIDTGLRFEIPPGSALHVYSRSGLARKEKVFVANAPGVIDSGYVGELSVILYNGGTNDYYVFPGNKIAQFRRVSLCDDELVEGVVDTDTDRGEAGFGSSGL